MQILPFANASRQTQALGVTGFPLRCTCSALYIIWPIRWLTIALICAVLNGLLGGKPEFPHPRGLFVLMPLHAAEDVIEHLDRREYMRAFVEHDAIGAL